MLLEILTGFGEHVLQIAAAHEVVSKAHEAIRSVMPERNEDLERAVLVAFEKATQEQAKQARTEDERLLWQQLHDAAGKLFPVVSESFPVAVTDALLIGDRESLKKSVWGVVQPFVQQLTTIEHATARQKDEEGGNLDRLLLELDLQHELPPAFLFAFGQVLKEREHDRAWIAFQREIAQKTYQKLREITPRTAFTPDEHKTLAGILVRLDGLADGSAPLPDFTTPIQELASEMRSEFDRTREVIRKDGEKTREAVSNIEDSVEDAHLRLDDIEAVDRRTLGEVQDLQPKVNRIVDFLEAKSIKPETPASIRKQDFGRLIHEKTQGFVGRQFVFDAVDEFVRTHPRGYFFVRGDPGIGKTALVAQLVKDHGYVHHFNVRADGINTAGIFLQNICSQLIVQYRLGHESIPSEATQDGRFFNNLLDEVAKRLGPEKKAIIVIDALDEVDAAGMPQGVNPLFLPVSLPTGVYIVLTMRKETLDRRKEPIHIRVDCEYNTFHIEHDSKHNMADIRLYVDIATERPGIHAYMAAQGVDKGKFITLLVEKSQGNFMYLHYVLPEIEAGAYRDQRLDALPSGLRNYYEDHWRRMRGHSENEEDWFMYKLPVVMALTVVQAPVSIDLIADFSGVQERVRIRAVLREWAQFLHIDEVLHEDAIQKRYRIYHDSFQDFISDKEEVGDERVSRSVAHQRIAENLLRELYDDEQP